MAIANALGIQQGATTQAGDLLTKMYETSRADVQPYQAAGVTALGQLGGLAGQQVGGQNLAAMGAMDPNISVDYGAIQADPMYQFAQSESDEMLRRGLTSGGMLGSSAGLNMRTQNAMQTALAARDRVYGQNVDQYNRGFDQQQTLFDLTNRQAQNQYNQQFGIAQLGQNVGLNMANVGAQYAGSYGELLTGMANAQAAGMLSQNALSAQQASDERNMWAGLGGTAMQNIGGITEAAGSLWDTVSGWF